MGRVRIFLISVLIALGIYVVVDDLWRTMVLATGAAFLCWGLLGRRIRRVWMLAGCVVAGFGLGMFDHHPIIGALIGAIVGVLLWRPITERRHRLKERT